MFWLRKKKNYFQVRTLIWRPGHNMFQKVNSKGADQSAWMRKMSCTFVVRMQQSQVFLRLDAYKAIMQLHSFIVFTYGPRLEKTCLRRFANNTGADQPAHPHSLISAFVIRLLKSIIARLATGEIFNFLASL